VGIQFVQDAQNLHRKELRQSEVQVLQIDKDDRREVCSADGRYGEFEWEGEAKEAGEAKI
jgi:hypothetical protein